MTLSQASETPSPSSRGGCPVKHSPSESTPSSSSATTTESSPWGSWFRRTNTTNTNTDSTTTTPKPCGSSTNDNNNNNTSQCPVQNGNIQSIEEANKHAQTPQPDQTIPLSTYRTISTIPKGELDSTPSTATTTTTATATTPNHQPATNNSKWVYPSEQQFYNAMKRKGWEIAPGTESTIPHVVQIHNAVNEKGWTHIRQWENLRSNDNPKLVKFIGRPKDLSPRATFYSSLWLRDVPFDRHDWFVSREDGSDLRRYVIDFYNGKEEKQSQSQQQSNTPKEQEQQMMRNSLPSMYLDVRPALDDTDAASDRMKMFVKDAFPGIASFLF